MQGTDYKKIEEKILKFWNDRDIFARSLEARKGKKRFVFFEGPPTANGRPGIHHFIGRVFKDLIPRYKTMRGYYVPRKAGWDTHGLPVELQVEKELGFTTKKEIEKYGIAKFNARAKKNVWKYKEDWQKFTKRIGFWIDLGHPYITYDPSYIESLWQIIAQFNARKLLYEGHKVLPWCTRCGTALSSHEVAQGYQEVTDKSVFVKFKAHSQDFSLLAWTTTPWTLPGNVALAVGEDIDYVVAQQGNERLVVAKALAQSVLGEYQVVRELKGRELVGLAYEPLFNVKPLKNKKSHTVYAASFVSTTDGTGIVHTAVMYGEDDYALGKTLGLPMHHTVAPDGHFTADVSEFEGQYVKKAEKGILENLESRGLSYKVLPYTHSYPFCWRCKTALLYYAKDSWFVAMSKLRKQLLANNAKVNWYPDHLREGRFGEFLKEVKDWAFSRERYWGTPLPVWKCAHCKAQRVIGSYAELETYRFTAPTIFHFVRHGESTKNFPEIIAGMLKEDTYSLTEKGKEEVRGIAERIKESGGVDLIYSSPFLRTKETAEIIGAHLGVPVQIDDRLREVFNGSAWEGKQFEDYKQTVWQGDEYANRPEDSKNEDGESWVEVRRRMMDCLHELDKKNLGKRILVVSHGDPLWLIKPFFEGITFDQLRETRATSYPKRGSLTTATFKNLPYNLSGELDPHRPYIDEITLKCTECASEMKRVKEVVDVWFDSGAMPYAQWHYPFSATWAGGPANSNGGENSIDLFKQNFPADYIAEGIDQTRGWFYTLLAIATALGKKAPYKNVISYSHVLDDKGKKMSKSVGNVVDPWEVIDQFGVDAARWYFYAVNNPGDPKLFALADVGKVQRGFMTTLFNCLRFYQLYEPKGAAHTAPKVRVSEPLDDWILSRLHRVISEVTMALDSYNPTYAARTLEAFVIEDLSNWWIRRSRERIAKSTEMLRYLLIEVSKLLAPFIPFTADYIYKEISNRAESVHLEDWPKARGKYINNDLELAMIKAREIVTLSLAVRKEKNIKVRQPLASIMVKEKVDDRVQRYILDEVNVKAVLFAPSQEAVVALDTTITSELKIEGYTREIMRSIQEMRKDAGYKVGDKVHVYWQSTHSDVAAAVASMKDMALRQAQGNVYDIEKEFELASGVKVWLGIKK